MLLRVSLLLIANCVIKGDLIKKLGSKLSECSDIIEDVDDFFESHLSSEDDRRLAYDEDAEPALVEAVERRLDTCSAIIVVVKEFAQMYERRYEKNEVVADTFEDPITLNIGGKYFTTSLATLRSKSDTFLEKMFRSNTSTATCSADGSFFIDRDPSTFGYVLEYLRNDDILMRSGDRSIRMQVYEDAEFFQLPDGLKEYLRWSSLDDGIALSFSEFIFLNKELKLVSKELGGLLYLASKDGASSSDFHGRCDNKGATVVIVESTKGNIFGGFTDQPWTRGGWSTSTISFLFRLRPSMKRYNKKNGGNHATYRHSSYGPIFGNGHDLLISSNCLYYTTSYTIGGVSYDVPKYELVGGGEKYFRVQDYAVLQAESL